MQERRRPHRIPRWWLAGGAALAALLLVIAITGLRGELGNDPAEPSPESSESMDSPTPTVPPAFVPPVSVADDAPLMLPQELRAAHGDFYLEAGQAYLARVEVSTVKPVEQPGLGMYLGVTFSCAGEDGLSEWIGGTENLLPGEPVTFTNQMVLQVEQAQVVTCSVRANAPYDDVAAAGATIELDFRWSVTKTDGKATTTSSEQRLPMTVDTDARAFAFTESFAAEGLAAGRVEMLSSLHLTTCTVVNGSREEGQTWCTEDDLHEDGSEFDAELRVDVLDENGEICETLGRELTTETLSLERHHQLLPLSAEFDLPEDLCGDTVRTSVVVDNLGPAPLVVHASNSSFITLTP